MPASQPLRDASDVRAADPTLIPSLVVTRQNGDPVLCHPATQQSVTLDALGTFVFERLNTEAPVEEIAIAYARRESIGIAEARFRVDRFIARLRATGLVVDRPPRRRAA